MPYDQSPRKKRVLSVSPKGQQDSDDDFEDIDEVSYSSETDEADLIMDEEEERVVVTSEEEQTSFPRRRRRSAKAKIQKFAISDDEDSDMNEVLPDLIEEDDLYKDTSDPERLIISYREDYLTGIKSSNILFRMNLPIASWLPILEKMNTQYVENGTLLDPTRYSTWKSLSAEEQAKEVELFLIRWKNLSYLHCTWESLDDLTKQNGPPIKQKMQRFYRAESSILTEVSGYGEDVYFNPDFTEVDRILAMRVIQEDATVPLVSENSEELRDVLVEDSFETNERFTKEYLVKWKTLQYCDISWECFDDFQNKEAIAQYYKHLKRDVSDLVHNYEYRPSVTEYRKISQETAYKDGHQLRSYQVEGINWLLWNWIHGRNSILADEMGLGKTVQSTMFIYNILYQYKLKPPFLVVAPLSTIPHWEGEIRRWTDMHVVVMHGTILSRNNIREFEWKSTTGEFDVLITTFEIAMVESKLLSSIPWAGCIVDEAHRLKGKNNKLGDILRKIEFGCKLLLTGTPLQNNTEELWTLLNFLQPEKFDDSDLFQNEFGDMKDSVQLEKLHNVLKPYMLRRMKEDVEKSLKPKEETVINVELTALQKKFYRAVYDHNTSVFIGQDSRNLPSLMNVMMELRKCCNHPFLIRGVEASVIEESYVKEGREKPAEMPQTTQELPPQEAIKHILNTSGKMVLLDKLLPKLQSQGHRVLLFSQMVRMLDIIQDYLAIKGYSFERIDGSVKVADRQAAIERFSAPGSDRFIFLICTRAGGFGINLTAADTVIIYDSDWNPQNDIQAQARCHRIGQDKAVNVYRLITNRTYEMEMFQRANLKLGLDKAVLNPLKQSIRSDGGIEIGRMSKKDAETLLKYGAYDFFKEEREGKTEELSNAFCEADIEQILEKNTKVITIDSQGGSSFSKASFITDTSAEVDINDPNFWTKIVGLKEQQHEEMGPRHRKRIEYHSVADDDSLPTNEAGFEEENDWIKTDRDALLKMLLSHGWGQWEAIYKNERMQRHTRSSIRLFSACIIGQLVRLSALAEEEGDFKKMHTSAVRSAQLGKEAVLSLQTVYPICRVLKESNEDAESGKENGVFFPHRYPELVRDSAWLAKMSRVSTRYLKHFSFLISLQVNITTFNIKPGATVVFPKARRSVLPAPWWGMEEDRDCILGTALHGWGNWKEMCNDPNLCFKQKGVIYTSQSTEEEENLMEVENEQEGEGENSPVQPISDHSKVFPPTSLLMKRIRRLVDTMEASLQKNTKMDYSSAQQSTPKKPKKSETLFKDDWSIKEVKSLRNAIFQWGLPIPPVKLNDSQLFSTNHIPLFSTVKEAEATNVAICDILDSLVSQVHEQLTPRAIPCLEPSISTREKCSSYHYHHCPLCLASAKPMNIVSYCIYCNCYVPYQMLRMESNNLHKTLAEVQSMARFMEESAIRLCELPNRTSLKSSKDSLSEIPANLPSNIDVLFPSTVLSQRLQSRLQLYYDLQQLVWKRDRDVLKVFIRQWMNSSIQQDVLSKGWIPYLHDLYLFDGLYRWGVVEWDIIWKDPRLPFYIDHSGEEKRKKGRKRGRKSKADETPEGEGEVAAVEETAPVQEKKDDYTYEDALRLKDPSVNRNHLVSGLSSLYVLKRINVILRYLKQYNAFAVITFVNAQYPESAYLARSKTRKVRVVFDGVCKQTNAVVNIAEEVFYKKNQRVNHNALYSIKRTSSDLSFFKGIQTRINDTWRTQSHEGDINSTQSFFRTPYGTTSQQAHFPIQQPYHNVVHSVAIRNIPRESSIVCIQESRLFLQNVKLPLQLKNCVVHSFGTIVTDRPKYHTTNYIWPVGYKSCCVFSSFINPMVNVEYICEILDGGSEGPQFLVVAADAINYPIRHNSPTSAWQQVFDLVNNARTRVGINPIVVTVNGLDMFGLNIPEVAHCIEGLEGVELCKEYVCRKMRDSYKMSSYIPKQESIYFNSNTIKREGNTNQILYNDKRIKEL